MQRTQINPEILQAMLESASNAADKGQSQWFTPFAFGQKCAQALPVNRPHILDFNCGAGHLLQASANKTTLELLGADIDPCRSAKLKVQNAESKNSPLSTLNSPLPINRITHDATLLAPMLQEVNGAADLLVLNPPWRLFWHRSRLQHLLESEVLAVRDAFAGVEADAGCPREGIDSTIAALLLALDLCTLYGEGMLIANNATLERLLFAADAPHGAAAKHVWLHCVIQGNPMTGLNDCNFQPEQEGQPGTGFHTGVIYFARDHTLGPKRFNYTMSEFLASDAKTFAGLRVFRQGAEIRNIHECSREVVEAWDTAKERVGELNGNKVRVPYNLWLSAGGIIRTNLSRFETRSRKVNKKEAARLFELNNKRPIELVLQRAQRDELLHVAEKAGWRVHPELLAAVRQAIQQYHSARAPLYPLSDIQRLGYLDEQDAIKCKLDLGGIFHAGESYPLRTQTVKITRTAQKPNLVGNLEDLEFTGLELAIFLKHDPHIPGVPNIEGKESVFMDAKLRNDPKTKVEIVKQEKKSPEKPSPTANSVLLQTAQALGKLHIIGIGTADPQPSTPNPQPQFNSPIDFTMQDLVMHFEIPDVPDVATVNPDGFQQYLNKLTELEQLATELA